MQQSRRRGEANNPIWVWPMWRCVPLRVHLQWVPGRKSRPFYTASRKAKSPAPGAHPTDTGRRRHSYSYPDWFYFRARGGGA